jgi:hypothetical protein
MDVVALLIQISAILCIFIILVYFLFYVEMMQLRFLGQWSQAITETVVYQ